MCPGVRRLVSIGMPVWNCRETLPAAVRSLLSQTLSAWELILIDDGSTDGTMAAATAFADPRIRIFTDGVRRGLAARLNQAIDLSEGVYFARMDGDDVAYPYRLERQVGYLDAHPEVDLVGAKVTVFGSGGEPSGTRGFPEAHEAICRKPFSGFRLAHPTYVGRLDWFKRFRYDPTFKKAQDHELLLRAFRSSRFANVPEILLGYREKEVCLKKTLAGRLALTRASVRESERKGGIGLAALVVVEQSLKTAMDCVAAGTGLGYRLLRHRAQPLTEVERADWARVWRDVSRDD